MTITKSIRKYRRPISLSILFFFLFQIVGTNQLYALTSGPSQPEFTDFEPSSTTEMVNPFTGDFTYNIPLFELPGPNGGYPFNLAYHAGIGPDQEASWVGLGWSLNAGAITRQVRGLPDEFKGDQISTVKKMKPNVTIGVGAGLGFELFGSDALKGQLGLTTLHNTYNGLSYTVDGGLGFPVASGSNFNSSLTLDFSLNTEEGLNLRPGLEISTNDEFSDNSITKASIGVGYHSRYGMSELSYGLNHSRRMSDGKEKTMVFNPLSVSYSAPLSRASNGFTPVVHTPLSNVSVSFTLSGGVSAFGTYTNGYLKGFRNIQNYRESVFNIPAYGYKNLQFAGDADLLDFNRERDGVIHEESPNLPVPVLTHDIYSIKGQGIGSMFRPVRNDIGVVYDNTSESKTVSASLGADISPSYAHLGVNLGLMFANNSSGRWDYTGTLTALDFQDFEINDDSEPWYYKSHGEHTAIPKSKLTNLGGEEAVAPILSGNENNPTVGSPSIAASTERVPRASIITEITYEDLLTAEGDIAVDLFKSTSLEDMFNDSNFEYELHHVAGYITTNDQGLRYVYALPLYNEKKEEVVFGPVEEPTDVLYELGNSDLSEDDHDHFIKTSTPPYAHTYLLTAVVGPDYVDVGENGVDQADLGYWVKFNYSDSKEHSWKSPFEDAFFQEGNRFDPEDNRASFEYGVKEVRYLDNVETKTHYAKFHTKDRSDMNQAVNPFDRDQTFNLTPQALERIVLIPKDAEGVVMNEEDKILEVVIETDYSLCKIDNTTGKLTLTDLHFLYGSSSKKLNEYSFSYTNNYDYDVNAQDRWGFYKPTNGSADNSEFPYVDQTEGKATLASYASAWSLSTINLPSGGSIEIEYEMDDYAYVQHKKAMEMVKISNASLTSGSVSFDVDEGFSASDYYNALQGEEVYFKALVNLKGAGENSVDEYISGYFEPSGTNAAGFTVPYDVSSKDYHPISERAWQYMRTMAPELITGDVTNGNNSQQPDVDDFFPFIQIMMSAASEVKSLFQSFEREANGKGWGLSLNTAKSWIRVPVLDGVKYGGGHRVKQILIKESDEAGADTYGQVYDYTIEENGVQISSGVAANEPLIGGEESPLRKAKHFTKSIPLHSDNNLFFEYPVNEGSFPGAQVGYRKVTVMSLAAADRNNLVDFDFLPNSIAFGTTGKTVHEFYTAKDFPTITHETLKDDRSNKDWIPMPFLGVNTTSFYTASQGYSIVNNDMHGKVSRTSHYRQLEDGKFESSPFSYTDYTYKAEPVAYDGELVQRLNNEFQEDGHLLRPSQTGDTDQLLLGVEQEMVIDARKYRDESYQGGLDFNIDLLQLAFFPVPIPVTWPNVSRSVTELKTVVTNKIIHKSGVLQKMETFNDGAKVTTEYLAWDKLTGKPLLAKVEDQFESYPVYNYTIPAHTQYDGMGPAYENSSFRFRISNLLEFSAKEEYEASIDGDAFGLLKSGDEVIFRQQDEEGNYATVGHGIYLGDFSGSARFFTTDNLDTDKVHEAVIFRSGKRNHLQSDVGQVTALSDPSNSTSSTINKTFIVPR